jgi:DNA-binding transcriptional MerR regulator
MLKIGDFSKLSRVSVKTLRYYDEIGLLRPSQVDNFTAYRFYTFDQLPRLHRILALKDLGFSLEQIAQVLNEGISAEQLRGMLRLKQVEIAQRVDEEQARLARVEIRLNQIEQENTMSTYDVILKQLEPITIASVRDIIPSYPEQGGLWHELGAFLEQRKAIPNGPCFTLYHSDEPEIDAEVCEPLSAVIPVAETALAGTAQDRIKCYQLPAVEQAASTIHHGPFVTISQAYEALIKWIDANGYKIVGPSREIYLRFAKDGSQTDPGTVTEIQFPVAKA